jgi:MoxR-like ATPase
MNLMKTSLEPFTKIKQMGNDILDEISKAIIGKPEQIKKLLTAIFIGGHILIEDYPGLGKTILAKSFAATLGISFKRIQFTPDLIPGDITGSYIFNRRLNQFELRKGPIFANLILADEINRASPKTQSALLEAMQEKQVTLEGETHFLNEPFIVVATQNPIEYEGTFPLPEAQLDRFFIKLSLGYPSIADEQEILERRQQRGQDEVELQTITHIEELLQIRTLIENVYVNEDISHYIAALVHATRQDKRIVVGASPRGSLAILKLARANAAMEGRGFVIPDDVKEFFLPAITHRVIPDPEYWMKPKAIENILQEILQFIPVPVIDSYPE